MRTSAILAVISVALVALQALWSPGAEVPPPLQWGLLATGLVGSACAAVVGLARGSWLYRLAVVLALVGVAGLGVWILIPLDRGAPVSPSGVSQSGLVLAVSIAFVLAAMAIGATEVIRLRRSTAAPRSRG